MVRYNIWQPRHSRLGGLRFALEEDAEEWWETAKVVRIMPTSFRYSSSLVLNLSQFISLIMTL